MALTPREHEANISAHFPRHIFWALEPIENHDASAKSNSVYKDELGNLSQLRAQEFLAGRAAAHRALQKLDPSNSPLKLRKLPTGAPEWPDQIVGSIAHQGQFAVAAVAKKSQCAGLGIDLQELLSAEREQSLLKRILNPEELVLLGENPELSTLGSWVFSAKEAGFKSLSSHEMEPQVITSLKLMRFEKSDPPRGVLGFSTTKATVRIHVSSMKLIDKFHLTLAQLG